VDVLPELAVVVPPEAAVVEPDPVFDADVDADCDAYGTSRGTTRIVRIPASCIARHMSKETHSLHY
jgi:hypothetical protein